MIDSDKQLVFGHRNPDTDAIDSAIAYSYLMNKLGYNTEAVAQGHPNDETNWVLKYFNHKAPRVITHASPEVKKVMLVDHNEPQQTVPDIKKVTVTHVVDHHRISNFNTLAPMYYTLRPWGCTSTILTVMFHHHHVEIPKQLAGLMMSAIISDTLLLKSPTTTKYDVKAIKELSKISGVDYKTYGVKELKAGTNVAGKSAKHLIDNDAKSYVMGGKHVRIDQINVVDLKDVMNRESEIKKAMKAEAKANGYDLFLVMVTNVLNTNSTLIAIGDLSVVDTAFGKKLGPDGSVNLPGVVSRKKQVVPPLNKAFDK
ncbi:MAG: manganese-dependent inorganic pyrophosphatase [Acetilactobacillus jinshanensis]